MDRQLAIRPMQTEYASRCHRVHVGEKRSVYLSYAS